MAIAAAQALGFNAVLMAPPADQRAFMRELCHERGLTLYLSTVFSGGPEASRQVMLPAEQARLAQPIAEEYMSGGEPMLPGEVMRGSLPCYARPEIRAHFRELVQRYAAEPVDGLAFDYIGWQNYRRCYCPVCAEQFASYRWAHPALAPERAETQWAEDVLVSFTNEMAGARGINPEIALTIHVYPWFAPDPYYGQRTDIDHVSETVAWFFRPAARVAAELRIIRNSGASALRVAELGYLLRKPSVAAAVARELGGSFRAAPSAVEN